MTSPTSSSTTADARAEHTRGEHSGSLMTTPALRQWAASRCTLCARAWSSLDGHFLMDDRAALRAEPKPVYNPTTREHFTPATSARATDAQLRFLKTLTTDRDTTAVQVRLDADRAKAVKGQLSKADASRLIELLKEQPFKGRATGRDSRCYCSDLQGVLCRYCLPAGQPGSVHTPQPAAAPYTPRKPWPKVDEGYYALTLDSLEGTGFKNGVNFFHIDRPTKGKFAGRTFVKIMASDAHHPVYGDLARAVLEGIAADPHAAQMLFAKESEHCFRCNRRLTDDESRAAGMGPTCRGK